MITQQQIIIGLIVAGAWFSAGFMVATILHLSKKHVQKRPHYDRKMADFWRDYERDHPMPNFDDETWKRTNEY